MRLVRYAYKDEVSYGFFDDDVIVPVATAAAHCPITSARAADFAAVNSLLSLLPHGELAHDTEQIFGWLQANPGACDKEILSVADVRLLRPVETPNKMFCLAGNYAAHIQEGGGEAPERAETFPYVFMKPSSTFNDPNASIPIPSVSPDHIDYECELGVIIGRRCKHVAESDALDYVAGYTVVNDISDRKYKPFPDRKPRPKDAFFDWLHGKWHDGFCPMGPCATSAHTITNPKSLTLTQHINGEARQNASTSQMIFPVAAIIEFISQSVTLTPGDVIATGTPEGVGATTEKYLRPGDTLEAAITGIGVLRNTMTSE
ncbi:MAG TPA: DUF2437 domain-containing protein [Candidatus Hydrogenedentes bacterium]|nr:DUF2437 domain-containing protein [Candidatus Hydrogenedentota bacterium]